MSRPTIRAVLFDRDGTLVEDVPYNRDPRRVRPMPGSRESVDLLRSLRFRTGVVTNQSGLGRGLLTAAELREVHGRVERLLGPFGTWQVCPHSPEVGCSCRKPKPGLVFAACVALRVHPRETVVIGDIAADVNAARAAGAASILVPTPATRPAEVAAAPAVAADLLEAARIVAGAPR